MSRIQRRHWSICRWRLPVRRNRIYARLGLSRTQAPRHRSGISLSMIHGTKTDDQTTHAVRDSRWAPQKLWNERSKSRARVNKNDNKFKQQCGSVNAAAACRAAIFIHIEHSAASSSFTGVFL